MVKFGRTIGRPRTQTTKKSKIVYPSGMNSDTDLFTTLDELDRTIDRVEACCPSAGRQVIKLRRLLNHLSDQIDAELRLAERRGFAPRGKPKLAKTVTGYSIEQSRQGLALSEHRSTGAAAFHCPRYAYDTVAMAIEQGPVIQKFESIRDSTAELLGDDIPIYWVRVAVRFFVSRGMLKHARARFEPVPCRGFMESANAVWKELESNVSALK
jgi:hypothetical protein